MRFLFYLSLLFLLYQIAKIVMRSMLAPSRRSVQRPMEQRRSEPRSVARPERSAPQKNGRIDYSKVKDADYRDLR